jgi:hypothetical protein
VLFKTLDGGRNWQVISPDLSREKPEVPANVGVYRTPELERQRRRGVIYTVAPSYKDADTIWAGTDDGLIHVTRDGGKTWQDVTPPGLTAWSKVALMDAGRFDAATAYAAVNRMRLDDMRPHVYRTHDGGKTWQEVVRGLPADAPVNVVREDPVRPGLLFAGTERTVFVSFNDGDDWQPLRLNLPPTSIRDLVVHGDDVVVGTHGRSFWILDDVTPLRQIDEKAAVAAAVLFRPQVAYRVRWNLNRDTPLPPEEPAGQNPPDGAVINYHLKEAAGPVTLEILDDRGRLVRRYSSADRPEPPDEQRLDIAAYWLRPPPVLSAAAGGHRFVWDLHHPPPPGPRRYPIAAIPRDTPATPQGPWALPGQYRVRLTAGGQSSEQPLTVKMDPRVRTPAEDLARQFTLSLRCAEGLGQAQEVLGRVAKLRVQVKGLQGKAGEKALAEALTELDQKAAALEAGGRRLTMQLHHLLDVLQGADAAPTPQAAAAAAETEQALRGLLGRWDELSSTVVPALNRRLRQAELPLLDP